MTPGVLPVGPIIAAQTEEGGAVGTAGDLSPAEGREVIALLSHKLWDLRTGAEDMGEEEPRAGNRCREL